MALFKGKSSSFRKESAFQFFSSFWRFRSTNHEHHQKFERVFSKVIRTKQNGTQKHNVVNVVDAEALFESGLVVLRNGNRKHRKSQSIKNNNFKTLATKRMKPESTQLNLNKKVTTQLKELGIRSENGKLFEYLVLLICETSPLKASTKSQPE